MRSRRSIRSGIAKTYRHRVAGTPANGDDQRTLSHWHAGLRAVVDAKQVQCAAIEAGGKDHAFADAKPHFPWRQVGDEHDIAADEGFRLAVACADAGKDLA